MGAGVGIVESPYKQYDVDVYPVPAISYESDNFWFRGLGGGYYLWNDESDKLSVTAYWSPMYFKPGDSDSEQLRKLDRRKSTMMAGLSYVHNTQYGFLRTVLAGDTLDITATVAPGAHGLVTTPGASRFYRSAGAPALQRTQATLATGARLEWLPLEALCY
ncbi:MipA/OmpV family protein, partial [Corallococcus coralloides]|nr:MipA/OmpV family protein [Corallococcus coralloides]